MNIALGSLAANFSSLGQDKVSSGSAGFAQAIGTAISQVEAAQSVARSAASDFLIGGKGEVHSVALAAQRAELSVEMFQQVRNKFVSAYQEIMRMPM